MGETIFGWVLGLWLFGLVGCGLWFVGSFLAEPFFFVRREFNTAAPSVHRAAMWFVFWNVIGRTIFAVLLTLVFLYLLWIQWQVPQTMWEKPNRLLAGAVILMFCIALPLFPLVLAQDSISNIEGNIRGFVSRRTESIAEDVSE